MFSKFFKKEKTLPEISEQYTKYRNLLLELTPDQIGIRPSEDNPNVWGVLIESAGSPKNIVSVRVTADGTTSIYMASGGAHIGIGTDPSIAKISRLVLLQAEECYSGLSPTTTFPLPAYGNFRFYFLTFTTGIFTAEAEEKELSRGKHTLSPFHKAFHGILFQNPLNPLPKFLKR